VGNTGQVKIGEAEETECRQQLTKDHKLLECSSMVIR